MTDVYRYPESVLALIRTLCPGDVKGEIREASFKIKFYIQNHELASIISDKIYTHPFYIKYIFVFFMFQDAYRVSVEEFCLAVPQ